MLKLNKTTVIITVMVLILASISIVLVVEGKKREDPGEVVWESKRYGDFALDNEGDFHISDGVLYGSAVHYDEINYPRQGQVIAVDLEEDEVLWNHSYHAPPQYNLWIPSIFVSNDTVYSGDQHGNVTAADAKTGEKIWTNSFHEGNYITRINSLHVSDGRLFTASRNKTVAAVDSDTGEKLWMHEHHNDEVTSVHAEGGTVYSVSRDGSVISADAETGEKIWDHRLHDNPVNSLFLQDGTVYTGGDEGELIAFDAEQEKKIWSHTYHDDRILSIHVDDGIVYSGSADVSVIAVDNENGGKLWRYRYHEESYGFSYEGVDSIQSVNGKVYSSHEEGRLIAVEKEGHLTLGISRTLTEFWSIIMEYFGWIIISITIALAIVALLFGKSRNLYTTRSDR